MRNEQTRQAPGLTGAGQLTPPSAASLWARSRARSPAESCLPATPIRSDQHLQSPEPPRCLVGGSGSPHGTILLCEFHTLETLLDPSVSRGDSPGKGHPACSHLTQHLPTARRLCQLTSHGGREHVVSATPPATLMWAKAPPTEKGHVQGSQRGWGRDSPAGGGPRRHGGGRSGKGLRDPGCEAFIQPQGAHGKFPFLHVMHGSCRETSTSTPQKTYSPKPHRPLVRHGLNHTPLTISHHSTRCLHSCATGQCAHHPEAPKAPGVLRQREPGGPWGPTCGSDLGPEEDSA